MGPRAQPDLNSLSFDIFSLEIRDLRSYQKKYFNKQVLGARNLSLRKIPYTISHTEHSHLKSEPLFLSADYPKAKGLLCVGPREDEVMNLLPHPLSLSRSPAPMLPHYRSRRYFSQPYSSYPTEGRNERVS